MIRRAIGAALVASLALATDASGASTEPEPVRVVLKFVKRGAGPALRYEPASCPACLPITDALWNADNARETVIALAIPRRRTLELAFDAPGTVIRRVLLEGGDVPFRMEGHRIVVALPPIASDAITAAEVATHIVEPGMVLRFEHADPDRRAGDYATGQFPGLQRQAADVLEFAQREVVRQLGLGEEVERRGLGRIQIMGFDTNAPHGHRDSPPHMHMHLRWPHDTGTQIGHYYIGADGLLVENVVGVKGLKAPDLHHGRGDAFTTIGPDGSRVYRHRITEGGWLELGRPDAPACLIRPAGPRGFADGAMIGCPGRPEQKLTVSDDMANGVLVVRTGPIVETFRYATDTGALLSPTAVPPPAPSVFLPCPDEAASDAGCPRGDRDPRIGPVDGSS